jgi:hypothetical protein
MAKLIRQMGICGALCVMAGLPAFGCSAKGSTLPAGGDSGGSTSVGGGAVVPGAGGGLPLGYGGLPVVGSGGGLPTGYGGSLPTGSGGSTVVTGSGGSGTPVDAHPGNSGIIPDDGGNFAKDWNVSGVVGSWYTYADTGGSSISSDYADPAGYGPFGNQNGEFCFTGLASGHQDTNYTDNWGAGVGLDLCAMPADMSWLPADLQAAASPEQKFQSNSCPTLLSAVNSVTFTISGSWGPEMRVGFKETADQDVAPFMQITAGGTYTITPADLSVPADWDVPNAGATGTSNIVSVNWQVASQAADTSFNFCISAVSIN